MPQVSNNSWILFSMKFLFIFMVLMISLNYFSINMHKMLNNKLIKKLYFNFMF